MKWNILAAFFLLLVICESAWVRSNASAAANGTAGPVLPNIEYEVWAPTHYQVYGPHKHFTHPDVVFKLLKELERIYEPYTDEQTNGRKTIVAELIRAADMDPRLCTRDYMKSFHDLILHNSPFPKTLVHYLGSKFDTFIGVCEKYLLNNLHKSVCLIKEEFRNDMEELARTISAQEIDGHVMGADNLNELWFYSDQMAEGVLEFMKSKVGAKLDAATYKKARDGKVKFYELFDKTVIAMCADWIKTTQHVESLSKYGVKLKLDHDEATWLTYSHMCRYFQRDYMKIRSRIYRQFLYHNCKYSKFMLRLHKKMEKLGCYSL